MYFRNYGLRKTWLYKCLKCCASEDPSTTNMVSGPKHCLRSKLITDAFCVAFWGQNTWLVLCFLHFLRNFIVAYLFLLTFKSIQRRVFVGLKPLKRKSQFATSFIYPNYQKRRTSFILTPNYIMKLSFLLFHLEKTSLQSCLFVLQPLQISVAG